MNLRFRDAAESDVNDALAWYEVRGHDLADQFLESLNRTLTAIRRNPEAFPKIHREIRRALLRRFPYCVFYIVEDTDIVVVGCLHGHRDPKIWRGRPES